MKTQLLLIEGWGTAASEIILMLLGAFLLGLLLGNLIWNRVKRTSDSANLGQELSAAKDLNFKLKKELDQCLNTKQSSMEASASAPEVKDDLKKIEGIGPKIQELLYNAGIFSFSQLAATEASKVKGILNDAGTRFQMHDPTTWPEQASLAAEGNWDKLKAWQDELKGGK